MSTSKDVSDALALALMIIRRGGEISMEICDDEAAADNLLLAGSSIAVLVQFRTRGYHGLWGFIQVCWALKAAWELVKETEVYRYDEKRTI